MTRLEPAATRSPDGPRFSLITLLGPAPVAGFEDTVRSVLDQRLTDWEWLLVVAGPADAAARELVADLAGSDRRIRLCARDVTGGAVAAQNDALAAARGDFISVLEPGATLPTEALERFDAVLDVEVDYAYGDHDVRRADGSKKPPHRKPDWAPERLRHHWYTGHPSVLRRSLVDEVGGFRPGFDEAADHDLALRVTERARRVVHVPAVLYHAPAIETGAEQSLSSDVGVRAVQEHVDRVGVRATVEPGDDPRRYRLVREPDRTTPVSVVIPTIGTGGLVWGRQRRMVVEAVRTVRARSRHEDLEFVVVYDTATPPEVLAELRALPGVRLRLVEFTDPFNFSAKCNVGALHATGEVLLFLNDDVEAESDQVVEQLIAPLCEDGVGATGPKLLFPDMRIQHAGVSYGSGGILHSYYRRGPEAHGVRGDLRINREVTALTGACLAVRREVFEEVGGFSEQLPVNYNDIDLCLKIARTGRRLLWLHDVVLFHFESVSRSSAVADWEMDFMKRRWGDFTTIPERHSNDVR